MHHLVRNKNGSRKFKLWSRFGGSQDGQIFISDPKWSMSFFPKGDKSCIDESSNHLSSCHAQIILRRTNENWAEVVIFLPPQNSYIRYSRASLVDSGLSALGARWPVTTFSGYFLMVSVRPTLFSVCEQKHQRMELSTAAEGLAKFLVFVKASLALSLAGNQEVILEWF